jgi:hypothetical protein
MRPIDQRALRHAAVALLGFPLALGAQATPNVPIGDPAYPAIQRLVHGGLVDSAILSQRPFTRAEVLRIVMEARRNLVRVKRDTSARVAAGRSAYELLIEDLEHRFLDDARAQLDRAEVDAILLDSPSRVVPHNGLGWVDARVNPLAESRRGRVVDDGATLSALAGGHARIGNALVVAGAVRQATVRERGGEWSGSVAVEQLYATVAIRNLLVQAGRDHLWMGPGHTSSFLSGNGPSLDMIKVTSSRPFVMPWLLRLLGPTKIVAFGSDLGGSRTPSHDWLVGYRVSVLPVRTLELGVSVMSQQGGSGSPRASVGERIADLFPLIDVIFLPTSDLQISNKFSGGDFRARFPAVRGLELYGEVLLDDFDARRLRSTFTEDAGIVAGVTVPRLRDDGSLLASVEYQRTGLRFYQHGEFRSGVTREHRFLGNPLGPNGQSFAGRVRHESTSGTSLAFAVVHERRSGDIYEPTGGDAEQTLRFTKTRSFPEELRLRATISAGSYVRGGIVRAVAEAGAERVDNLAFEQGRSRTNWVARAGLEAHF